MPRFIINIRELRDRELRWYGIDTGFGVVSQAIANENVAVTPWQGRGLVVDDAWDSEPIRLEVLGNGMRQV